MSGFEIKSLDGRVLWSSKHASVRPALEEAVKAMADLSWAYLGGAYLGVADLGGANLRGAYLGGANLRWAHLRGANLGGADLRGADLGRANLGGAYLGGADLGGAYLRWAYLGGADLSGANLSDIKTDFFKVLNAAPREASALRAALVEGRVDGSVYDGDCACLVGTIANARGCPIHDLGKLKPRAERPAERWFLAIEPKTPTTHPVVQITLEWIDEWLEAAKSKSMAKVKAKLKLKPKKMRGA